MIHGLKVQYMCNDDFFFRIKMGTVLYFVFFLFVMVTKGVHPHEESIVNYIKGNVWPISGLPKSYYLDDLSYWDRAYSNDEKVGYMSAEKAKMDVGRKQERFITKNGLNLYDGSCWQIAMGLSGDPDNINRASYHTRHLLANQTFQWNTTRGTTKSTGTDQYFFYGDNRTVIGDEKKDNAYFFRTISEVYSEADAYLKELYSITNYVQWMDWKPVTGENAWCGYIGPIQTIYFTYGGGKVPWNDPNIRMACGLLVAIEAMQNEAGAFYHVPTGTAGKLDNEISNENNFSLYAGLKMLREVLLQMKDDEAGNLIRNPGFSEANASQGQQAQHWVTDDAGKHGGTHGAAFRSTICSHDGDGSCASITASSEVDYGVWWQDIPMEAGQNLTLSAWFSAQNGWSSQNAEMEVEFYNYNGAMRKISEQSMSLNNIGDGWEQISITVTAPVNTVWARCVVRAEENGSMGTLFFDEIMAQITPITIDVEQTLARLDVMIEKQENYFRNNLFNATDEVFFTGGTYSTNDHTFTPYIFNPLWIGGPYCGSNTFSGKTIETNTIPLQYWGTNLYTGYNTVLVDVWTENACDWMNIQWNYLTGWITMHKISDCHFQYEVPEYGEDDVLTYRLNMFSSGASLKSSNIRWTVDVLDPPKPYTKTCEYLFAVDCQTWGMTALGAQFVDDTWGENAAYDIWQKTKEYGGYYETGYDRIRGVGFSDINNSNHDVCSAEWTFGAILMCRELAKDYLEMGKAEMARELLEDADSMRAGVEALRVNVTNIQTVVTSDTTGNQITWDRNWANWGSPCVTNTSNGQAYLYANRRYEIPFGWWANPLPSLASTAWAIMNDRDFNPFQLGGKAGRTRRNMFLEAGQNRDQVEIRTINMLPGDRYILQMSTNLVDDSEWKTIDEWTADIEQTDWLMSATEGASYYRLIQMTE